jgi:hypothetical protein
VAAMEHWHSFFDCFIPGAAVGTKHDKIKKETRVLAPAWCFALSHFRSHSSVAGLPGDTQVCCTTFVLHATARIRSRRASPPTK